MKYIVGITLFIFLLSLTFIKADDLNVDLGRHIVSGGIIVNTHSLPRISLFSYTEPRYPFVNHYWLTEVIFYSLNSIFGLIALFYLKEIIVFLSIGIILYYTFKKYGAFASGLASLFVFPFFVVRNVIRPELFGYLFFSILFILLLTYPKSNKYIFLIPLIMLLWVNLSITFIFGILIIGILLLKVSLREPKIDIQNYKKLGRLLKEKDFLFLLVSLAVLFINPHGIQGIIEPFLILKTPVYKLSEMESIFTVVKTFPHPIYTYIMYLILSTPILCIHLFVHRKFILFFFLTAFLITAAIQNRNIIFFTFIFIPSFGFVARNIANKFTRDAHFSDIKRMSGGILLSSTLIVLSIPFFNNSFYKTFDIKEHFGQGFYEDAKPAIEFMQKNNLPKNIFNNFNVSGYFIYKTYPAYKPFIDNRPEAYSSSFLEKIYLPVFESNMQKQKVFEKYDIRTVFLQLDTGDQGARKLATDLNKDSRWKLAFLDNSIVIFTKDQYVKDLKRNSSFLKSQVGNKSDYLELGKLASNFALLGYNKLADSALKKANELNPNSCNIKRLYYEYYTNANLITEAEMVKGNNWYCFFYM